MKAKKNLLIALAAHTMASVVLSISLPVLAIKSNASNNEKPVFDPNEWLTADAYYDTANDCFILTEDYSSNQTGSVWYNHPYDNNLTLDMDYYTGSSDRRLGGADGLVVAFYANYIYTMSSGEEMGFTGCGGYGIELDTYCNENQGGPDYNHISLIKENVGTHLVTNNLVESEDEKWHHLRIVVEDGICTVYVDGSLKITHAVQATGYGWIGITSATGDGQNLHAVKNVTVSGNNATSIDGKYLDLKLSHKKISNNCILNSTGGVYEYEITAEVKNSAEATASNISTTLDIKEGLWVADEASLSVNLGDIASGESNYAKWTVYADWPESNIAANYSVTANIGNSVSLRQENYIYLFARNEMDNTFILGVDEWNFTNSNTYFNPNNNESYYLSAVDYAVLMARLNNTERYTITNYLNSKWNGSCYGMSAVAVLVKMGVIEPTIMQDRVHTLHDVMKVNNDNVESFINFYHFQQKTNAATMDKIRFALLSTEEQLSIIETMATGISSGSPPFILCFNGKDWGHAVVAYGIERGEYSFGGFLGLFADEYDSRILIYDCSNPASPEESYLYFNSGTDEWYMPKYKDANKLIMACNDISILDYVNNEITTSNLIAHLEFEGEYGYQFEFNGNNLQIDSETDLKSEGIIAFYDANILADGTNGRGQLTLTLPSLENNYTVIPSSPSKFNMYYENFVLSVDCLATEQIDFIADGGIAAKGVSGDYSLSLIFNEETSSTSWTHTTVSGTDGKNIALVQTENGIVLTGDNLQDVTITTTGSNGTQTIVLSTNSESILLTSPATSGDAPIVMLDTDGDGIFDTEYYKYTINFDANGGFGEMNPINCVSEGVIYLPANSFSAPNGMRFKGWSETASGDVIIGTEYVVTKSGILYAIWEEEGGINNSLNETTSTDLNGTEASPSGVPYSISKMTISNTNMIIIIVICIVVVWIAIGCAFLLLKKKR